MTQSPVPTNAVPPASVRRRTLWRTILWSVVIFLSGSVSGWGLGLLLPVGPPPPPPLGPEPPIDQIVRSMTDELLLSPPQVVKVQQLYHDRAAALREVRHEVAPRFAAEYDKLEAGLKDILTREQFERWRVRFDAARQRLLPPGPNPGGPGPMRGMGPPQDNRPEQNRPPHGPPDGPHGGPPGYRPDQPPDMPPDGPPYGPPDRSPAAPSGPPR